MKHQNQTVAGAGLPHRSAREFRTAWLALNAVPLTLTLLVAGTLYARLPLQAAVLALVGVTFAVLVTVASRLAANWRHWKDKRPLDRAATAVLSSTSFAYLTTTPWASRIEGMLAAPDVYAIAK